jgi:hypothetical protein
MFMRPWLVLPIVVISALALSAAGLADPGQRGSSSKSKGKVGRSTFMVVTTDNGSCGTPWATDTLRRTFHVKANRNGTYTLTRRDRGTFLTMAARSPGACDTSGNHGQTVLAGAKGRVVGFLRGTVSGGTFDPNAACSAPAGECGFTDVFIATHFGAGATFSCFTNSRDCQFNYNYTAPATGGPLNRSLVQRHWQNKGKGAGTFLDEQFSGDIAHA